MTTLTGAIRPRTTPQEEPETPTYITADGDGFHDAYGKLQALVPGSHIMITVRVND